MSDAQGWVIIEYGIERHILPSDEVEQHTPRNCTCRPTPELDDPNVIVHHSFDGREVYERGERKPN